MQRLRPTLPPPAGVVAELALAGRAGSPARRAAADPRAGRPPPARRRRARRFAGGWEATAARRARRRARGRSGSSSLARGQKAEAGARRRCRIVAYRPLFSGPAVDRAERLHFLKPGEIVLAHADAIRLGLAEGQQVVVAPRRRPDAGPLADLADTLTGGACACRGRPAGLGRAPRSRQRARRARRLHPRGHQGVRAGQPADGLLRDHDRDRAQADRPAPGRATARTASGRIGLLQPIADLGKLAQKQHAVPVRAHASACTWPRRSSRCSPRSPRSP